MAEIRIGGGKSLENYKIQSIIQQNMDIEVMLENGDIIEICTRKHGYALRVKRKGEDKKTILDMIFSAKVQAKQKYA